MMNKQKLITELQSQGLKLTDSDLGASGRKGAPVHQITKLLPSMVPQQ